MIELIWLFLSLQISTRLILTIEKEEEKDSNKNKKEINWNGKKDLRVIKRDLNEFVQNY